MARRFGFEQPGFTSFHTEASTIVSAMPRKDRLAMWLASRNNPIRVMGVLNVTPDSFSDGGRFQSFEVATSKALEMINDGAEILDVGPESTRPGSNPVNASEQIDRAIPVIESIRRADSDTPISIDTRLARVAEAAVAAGADMVNDISAMLDDPDMPGFVATTRVPIVLMHRRGDVKNMQDGGGPHYENVVAEISKFLQNRRAFSERNGIDRAQILFDPGIGFGKRVEHNLQILRRLNQLLELGQPLVLGASRKSFIGAVAGIQAPAGRLPGSLACAVIAAHVALRTRSSRLILRVHDVAETIQAVRLCHAVAAS